MEGGCREELMSSLPLGGDFIKFAANNHRLPSVAGPLARSICVSTGYFDAPQNGHSCIPVKALIHVRYPLVPH